MAGLHPETVSPLVSTEKEAMIAYLLRTPELYALAKGRISREHFDPATEGPYMVLWMAAQRVATISGEQVLFGDPGKARLCIDTAAHAILDASPGLLVPEAWHQLFKPDSNGLLSWIYEHLNPADIDLSEGRYYIKKFLQEREQRLVRRAFMQAGDNVLANLPEVLKTYHDRTAAIGSLDANPFAPAIPDDWTPHRIGVISTGWTPSDTFMNDGWAPGEVYGIVGAFGSGKTTLAVQLLYQGALAEAAHAAHLASKGEVYKPGHWLLFHYEAGRQEMQNRLICHAAEVNRDSLDKFHPVHNKLSTSAELSSIKEYEKKLFADKILKSGLESVPGEKERIAAVRQLINERVHLVDMSCPPEAPTRGTGGPMEIAALVEQAKRQGMDKISGVIVDYVGLCAKRYLRSSGGDQAYLRHGVGDFGDEMHRLVASPHGCCVWCMHQLNGEANKMSPHKPATHADAAEARNFAENMWFAFALGIKHEESSCCLLTRSKSRRAGSSGVGTVLVRLEGHLGRFVEETGDWCYQGSQIQKSSFGAQVAGSGVKKKDKEEDPAAPGAHDGELNANYTNNKHHGQMHPNG